MGQTQYWAASASHHFPPDWIFCCCSGPEVCFHLILDPWQQFVHPSGWLHLARRWQRKLIDFFTFSSKEVDQALARCMPREARHIHTWWGFADGIWIDPPLVLSSVVDHQIRCSMFIWFNPVYSKRLVVSRQKESLNVKVVWRVQILNRKKRVARWRLRQMWNGKCTTASEKPVIKMLVENRERQRWSQREEKDAHNNLIMKAANSRGSNIAHAIQMTVVIKANRGHHAQVGALPWSCHSALNTAAISTYTSFSC